MSKSYEIILELRATRDFLQENINTGFEEVNARLENIEVLLQKVIDKF